MQNNYTLRNAFLLVLALFVGMTPAVAQQSEGGNVTIEVYKNQDGQLNVESEVRDAQDLGSLENLLKQYGVQEELGDLQPGEEVEVIIRRKKKNAEVRNMVINIDRDFDFPAPPPPPKVERAQKPLLGVYYEVDVATNGGKITSVMPNTGAEAANLQAGDVILQVDDVKVDGIQSLQEVIKSHKPGDKVMLTILRDDKELQQEATLGENKRTRHFEWHGNVDFDHMNSGKSFNWNSNDGEDHVIVKRIKEDKDRPMLGVYLNKTKTIINGEEIKNDDDGPGIGISGVVPNTAAAEMGLQDGDRIIKVNGANVAGAEGIGEVLKQSKVGDRVEVEYLRDGKTQTGSAVLSGWKAGKEHNEVIEIKDFDFDFKDIKDLEKLEGLSEELNGMMRHIEKYEVHEDNEGETIREFRMVVIMEDVSSEEAEALSARSGEEFSGQSDLALESFTVGPNPNSGMFSLSFDIATKGETQIRVLDVNGGTIYKEDLGNFSGTYDKEFDISNFSKGVYFLQISQNDRAFTKKVVTQ